MEHISNITTLGSTEAEVAQQAADVAPVQRQLRLAQVYEQTAKTLRLGTLVDVQN